MKCKKKQENYIDTLLDNKLDEEKRLMLKKILRNY